MQAHILLRIGFTNWNITEKYFRMNFLSRLSAKNDLLNLRCWVRVKAYSPGESPFITSRSLTVDNRDASSGNNFGLH